MKIVKGQSTENTFEVLDFDILTNSEMNDVRGGGRPKSKDKDVFDLTED